MDPKEQVPALLGSITSAARELDVSEGTVRNYIDRGILRAQRDVRGRRFPDPADVARLKAERAAKAPNKA